MVGVLDEYIIHFKLTALQAIRTRFRKTGLNVSTHMCLPLTSVMSDPLLRFLSAEYNVPVEPLRPVLPVMAS